MSSKKLLDLVNPEGEILAPQTLKLGQLGFKESIELAWAMTEVASWTTSEKITLRPSRAPNPGRVRHRIVVGKVEMYGIHVDMKGKFVSLEGPFVFRTPPGASDNLCDYLYVMKKRGPAPITSGTIRARSPTNEPRSLENLSTEVLEEDEPQDVPVNERRLGDFVRVITSGEKEWIGQLVERNGEKVGLRWLKPIKNTDNYRLMGPVWAVSEHTLDKRTLEMKEVEPLIWTKVKPPPVHIEPVDPIIMTISRSVPPPLEEAPVNERRLGDFIRCIGPGGKEWFGQLAERNGEKVGIRWLQPIKGTDNYQLNEKVWPVFEHAIEKGKIVMTEVEPLVFKKVEPSPVHTELGPPIIMTISRGVPPPLEDIPKPVPAPRVGSFLLVRREDRAGRLGRLAEEKTGTQFAVHWLNKIKGTKTGQLSTEISMVDESAVVRIDFPMREVGPNVWERISSSKRSTLVQKSPVPDVIVIDAPEISQRVLPLNVPSPAIKRSPSMGSKKRMEGEIRQLQSQSKRLKRMVETLERAAIQIATRWDIALPE